MGRPRLTTKRYRYYINPSLRSGQALTLHAGQDDDLIALLADLPPRQRVKVIKTVLRAGLQAAPATQERNRKLLTAHKEVTT